MTILDRITYTQILNRAGFTVHEVTELATTRGSGVAVHGVFERWGTKATSVLVKAGPESFTIDGQEHFVRLHLDGTFDLFIAHGDHPR